MKVNEFISTLRNEFNCDDDALILKWIELNADLAESVESELETELDDTARALYFVKNNFIETTLRSTLTYPTLANEIINSAVLFHAGRSIEVVDSYAQNGIIECGYIPSTYDERGTLSIVQCDGYNGAVFICHDIPADELRDMAEQAVNQSREVGSTVGKEFESYAITDQRIRNYGKDVIGTFMLNIYSLDKDCSAFGCRVCCLPDIKTVTVDKHPTLIAAETEIGGEEQQKEKESNEMIFADVVTGKDIALMFYTQYCPNVEDDETEMHGFTPQI